MESDNKEIKVENGTGENIEISPVYTHLNVAKPKNKDKDKKGKIIIPDEKK